MVSTVYTWSHLINLFLLSDLIPFFYPSRKKYKNAKIKKLGNKQMPPRYWIIAVLVFVLLIRYSVLGKLTVQPDDLLKKSTECWNWIENYERIKPIRMSHNGLVHSKGPKTDSLTDKFNLIYPNFHCLIILIKKFTFHSLISFRIKIIFNILFLTWSLCMCKAYK